MRIWVKLNDNWGYTGIAIDSVDKHLSTEEISNLIGETVNVDIEKIFTTNCSTDTIISGLVEYMGNLGWKNNKNSFRSNGDDHTYEFFK